MASTPERATGKLLIAAQQELTVQADERAKNMVAEVLAYLSERITALIRQERERAFDAGAHAVDEFIEGCEVDPLMWTGEEYLAARRAAVEGRKEGEGDAG